MNVLLVIKIYYLIYWLLIYSFKFQSIFSNQLGKNSEWMYHTFLLADIIWLPVRRDRLRLFIFRRFFLYYLRTFWISRTFWFRFGIIWILRLILWSEFFNRWYAPSIQSFTQFNIFLNKWLNLVLLVLMFEIKNIWIVKLIEIMLLVQLLKYIFFIEIKLRLQIVMINIIQLQFLLSFHFIIINLFIIILIIIYFINQK